MTQINNRAEAVSEFVQRRFHPRCPVDGHNELWFDTNFIRMMDGSLWLAYQCKRCRTCFHATVFEKEPEGDH